MCVGGVASAATASQKSGIAARSSCSDASNGRNSIPSGTRVRARTCPCPQLSHQSAQKPTHVAASATYWKRTAKCPQLGHGARRASGGGSVTAAKTESHASWLSSAVIAALDTTATMAIFATRHRRAEAHRPSPHVYEPEATRRESPGVERKGSSRNRAREEVRELPRGWRPVVRVISFGRSSAVG